MAAVATVVGLAYYLRFAAVLLAPVPVDAPAAAPADGRQCRTRWAVGVALVVTLVLSVAPALAVGLLAP